MLRQKRTTVGLLTCDRSASSLTGSLAKARGSAKTSLPTLCSAGASEGNDALIRSNMWCLQKNQVSSLQQKPSRAIIALEALGPQVPAA